MVNKKWIYILILFIIIGIRFTYVDANAENYYWDEVTYLHLGQNIGQGSYSSPIGEEFRAPLFPYLLSLFGYAHLFVFFLTVFGLVLVYFLGKEVFNEEVGFISAIILGAMQLYFFYSFKVLTEPLTIIFIVGAMIFMYRQKFYFASVLLGLAVLTRYLAGVFVVAFFAYLAYQRKRKELVISGIIFGLMLTPLLVLGWINYGNPFGMLIENFFGQITQHGSSYYYFINFLDIFGWFIPLMFLYGLFSKKDKKPLLFFIVIYFVAITLITTRYERFAILLFPFIAVIAGYGIYKLEKKYHIGLILLVVWCAFNIHSGLDQIELDRYNTDLLITTAQELDLDGTVMSNSPVYFLYFSDMDVIDIPEDEIDVDFDYFILDNYHPRTDYGYTYYTNYIKEEGKIVYNFTEDGKEVIVYEKG